MPVYTEEMRRVITRSYHLTSKDYTKLRSQSLDKSTASPFYLSLVQEGFTWFETPAWARTTPHHSSKGVEPSKWYPDGKLDLVSNKPCMFAFIPVYIIC